MTFYNFLTHFYNKNKHLNICGIFTGNDSNVSSRKFRRSRTREKHVLVCKTHQMRVLFCLLYLLHLWFSYNFRVLVRSHEPSASWLLREKSLCHQVSYRGAERTNKLRFKNGCLSHDCGIISIVTRVRWKGTEGPWPTVTFKDRWTLKRTARWDK